MKIILFLLISFLFPVNIKYHIPSDSLFIGSVVYFEVHLEDLSDDEFPTFTKIENDTNYSLLEYKLHKKHAYFKIQFWEKGLNTLPPIQIDIINSDRQQYAIHTKPIDFFIFSNLNDSTITLKKIKNMSYVNLINKNKLIVILIIMIGLIFLSYYFFKKINTYNQSLSIIKNDNIKISATIIEKINNLREPINENEIEDFYSKLSYLARDYIKKKFYIRSTEMTTYEIFKYLRNNGFNYEIYDTWDRINKKSDMAKYALSNFRNNEFKKDKESFISFIEKLNET